ncbi:MAG: B12-binding domain-containing radical SAM protein [Oscillospiraceae bacterium]|nr:B12-binding domain-containing radical SAM protein [Oscillospiraceae bacterium]
MSKVVLLAINAKYVHSSLAVWVLAGGVTRYAKLPHDVHIVESTIHQHNDDIVDLIAASAPDVVGISTYIWNASKLPGLLKLLRESLPDTALILGGPEASHNAAFWLKIGADFVLHGEGEYNLPMLLDALAEGKPAPAESSLPAEPIDPYNADYLNALQGRLAYLETSRGCPFQCAFCLSGGSGVRFFPIESAKTQIYKLSQSGARTIKFVDRTFNCDANRAYELFEYIIGLDTTCCFHFEVGADLFDERTLSLLSTAPPGRIQIEAGLQSFFEPALNASSRQTDLHKAEQNIRAILQSRNIHVHVDLIAGLPYETLPDFQNGFDRAYALGAHTLQLGFLKLLHGSQLRAQAENLEIHYSAEPPYEIQHSPWLSAEDLQTLKHAENALQHTYNKGRFLSVLEYVLSVSGIRPFSLFRALGEAAPNHATSLSDYAVGIYDFCVNLPGIDANALKDRLICDWLSMVKGKNAPHFLKNDGRNRVTETAEQMLGRKIPRVEAAMLSTGKGVFADSVHRDPVTGLYTLHFVEL